jgi:hypothetical protein
LLFALKNQRTLVEDFSPKSGPKLDFHQRVIPA